ncbi:acyl-CoA dehydratase activase-related protein [Desulfosporosinus sp. BICA1-9]|uniref:acyl-CoA dehydratase activase-related protein n=1 Tax=Desulfosporosinus sp. BICA1-9 TaxID=1531958 RepID=UPI00054B58F6|nr:CoA protein activase [Desulfosporosinus sp. BICA1-9]KJS47789.1 MAG: CoA protein activase [Peptococcaceae bacterium BRH_c23]KJS81952.1 MAG: CoA protein activase [Desulfosporosinus sp. BICA1-9]
MKVTFPHMGNAWIVIQTLFESLNVEVVVPPVNSKRTLNLGTRLAPESACLPLKLNLGNYLEAADQGADTIVITGGIGPCRFGYYGEVERQILRDAGYDYEVVTLEPPNGSLLGLAKRIRYLAGTKNSWTKILRTLRFTYLKSVALDRVEDLIHAARPRLPSSLSTERLYEEAKSRLGQTMSEKGIFETVHWLQESIRERQAKRVFFDNGYDKPLRIGIVGEIYTILDPYSSIGIEEELGRLGVEVDRSIYLSGWVGSHIFQGLAPGYRSIKSYPKHAKPYLPHFVGGHGRETVGAAVKFAREGFDGIIQIFPLSCMPEIVAASILPKVQEAYKIPIMTLIVDEHTGQAGIQTRLEAFVDLLERPRLLQGTQQTREEVLGVGGR